MLKSLSATPAIEAVVLLAVAQVPAPGHVRSVLPAIAMLPLTFSLKRLAKVAVGAAEAAAGAMAASASAATMARRRQRETGIPRVIGGWGASLNARGGARTRAPGPKWEDAPLHGRRPPQALA